MDMKKAMMLMGFGVVTLLYACGGGVTTEDGTTVDADCSCDEVQKRGGKYYLTGIIKEDERLKNGELFTGTCATLNAENKVLETGEFNNGIVLWKKEWKEVDGELYQTLDMTYENGKQKNGYKLKLEGQHGYLYPIEYNEYKNRQDVAHYSMMNGYGKTVMSGDVGNGFFESDCVLEGYDVSEAETAQFLKCIEKEKLPKFFFKKR